MSGAWYDDDGFWTTFAPILFSAPRMAATAGEVDAVVDLAALEPGQEVLDLACGPGRHALELARRGLRVTGVDRTAAFLQQLSRAAREEGLEVEVVRRDMRDFRRPERYHLVLSYFTSFGYFDDRSDDLRVLRNAHDSLRPGGSLVVDVLGKEVLARGFVERWWKWLTPERLLLEEREVLGDWARLRTSWTLVEGGERRTWSMVYRLYSARELEDMLRRAGFDEMRFMGDLSGAPYDRAATRLVAHAVRSP